MNCILFFLILSFFVWWLCVFLSEERNFLSFPFFASKRQVKQMKRNDNIFVTADDSNAPGDGTACGNILVVLSWILVILTMPFSLFVCFKVRYYSSGENSPAFIYCKCIIFSREYLSLFAIGEAGYFNEQCYSDVTIATHGVLCIIIPASPAVDCARSYY